MYPGITFEYQKRALTVYLDLIEEHVHIAGDQYTLRAKQNLKRYEAHYTTKQLNSIQYDITDVTKNIIPLYFLNTALIPVWGHFESFLEVLANYIHDNEDIELKIKDIRADNIILQALKYFKVTINVDLPWNDKDKSELLKLKELRNVIVHDNGRITDNGDSYYNKMLKIVEDTDGVELIDSNCQIIITNIYLRKSEELVNRVLSQLNKLISDRYGGLLEAFVSYLRS